MGTLYLVRHGQASFGAADYDQLSDLGRRQCQALGEWMAGRGLAFEAVLCGTLRRHGQSLAALAQGHGALPPALAWPGLNEYDSEALIRAVHPGPLETPATPEAVRAHFRLLRQGLEAWIAGLLLPEGMPSHVDFVAGVQAALDHVRQHHQGDVLLVSSGGPIATAVALVLGTAPETMIDLNMRIRNSALTEFVYTPRRHMLLAYNQLPHLDAPERRAWLTYS
ncbi:Histidine phosphatase family protein [Rubrivivax sp. A210]|uniref:histidine phosphatase family protein n=1 Tax=Rubrivivax sp. A210 TaxID=2772301 RepID=UPI0019195570|nr:histidine phosphatase family protein [Rubrivivax sp. A210]CAD5373095.1 Histidine phosphatase family protein [Rubrivivax sp. A210]